jgi:hypothetical protein
MSHQMIFNIQQIHSDYSNLLTKMLEIYELKKKYTTKVMLNITSLGDAYLTFDKLINGNIEINLRHKLFKGEAVCGVPETDINNTIEEFEKRFKDFKDNFLEKRRLEELDINSKGFTELKEFKIKFKTYPSIEIIKSTGVIDFIDYKSIKCSWEKPIEKTTAKKLMSLKKKDLILSDGTVNYLCNKIISIELQTIKTATGVNICFGMIINFKNGKKII